MVNQHFNKVPGTKAPILSKKRGHVGLLCSSAEKSNLFTGKPPSWRVPFS